MVRRRLVPQLVPLAALGRIQVVQPADVAQWSQMDLVAENEALLFELLCELAACEVVDPLWECARVPCTQCAIR